MEGKRQNSENKIENCGLELFPRNKLFRAYVTLFTVKSYFLSFHSRSRSNEGKTTIREKLNVEYRFELKGDWGGGGGGE